MSGRGGIQANVPKNNTRSLILKQWLTGHAIRVATRGAVKCFVEGGIIFVDVTSLMHLAK
jgi:hypothetical protein